MPVHIIENAGPPLSAPTAIGIHFIDTVSGIHYFSTGTSTVADWAREDKVIEDTVDPSSAPPAIGLHWVNTVSGVEFFSTGTSATEDWKERGAGGGGAGGGFAATLKHLQVMPGPPDDISPQQNFPRISDDGGKTFRGRYTGDRVGCQWQDISDGGMMQGILDTGQGTMWHGNKFDDGTPMTGMLIRWTRDNSASSPWGRNTQNIYDKTGTVLVKHAVSEDDFAYVAQNSAITSNIICLHTLAINESAGEYIKYSTNSGSTFFNDIILPAPDPLRVHIETGAIPAMYGLWSFGGNYFAALETVQGNFEDVTVFRSVDLGNNWTSYATFTDYGGIHAGHATAVNKSGPAFAHGAYDGKMVVPGVGVFVFASNGSNHCPVIYKDSDGASGFSLVYTYNDPYSESACPNPQYMWEMNMHGWGVDSAQARNYIWAVLYNNTTGRRITVFSEDDGATWDVGEYDGDSGFYLPFPMHGFSTPAPSGWNRCWQPFWYDGYACRGFFNNGTDAGAIMTLDGLGFFADPYLNRSMGATQDPYFEQLLRANGTPNWWPINTLA